MKDKLQRQIERLTRAHKRHSHWQRLVAVLAGVVALCTLGVLMMPAVAMEGEPHCGKAEHTHTDACYTQVLTCGQEEGDSHTHTEACYTRELTCGLEEHTHTDACYRDAAESTATPEPETTAEPTETPAATEKPEATAEPTATPEPTVTPTATVTPVPSATPNQTEGQEDDNGDNATVFAVERAADDVIADGNCGKDAADNVTWTLTKDGTLTIRGQGATADYWSSTVPWYSYKSQIQQVVVEDGVTGLGNYLFGDCKNIDKVTLPDSVTGIGNYTFQYCPALTELTLPDGVESIGDGAFWGCYGLTEMILPDSVNKIGSRAFYYCTSLTKAILPNRADSVGTEVFEGCKNLESATLPEGMTALGTRFFEGCEKLTDVTIPASVTEIGQSAFSNCKSLKDIKLPAGVKSIGDSAFSNCGIQGIELPEGLETIGSSAFSDCTGLTKLTLPGTVQTLGKRAFYGCYNLQTIKLSSSLTEIPENAFNGDWNLTAITIPEGVTKIGDQAFGDCRMLSAITLPDSLQEIGYAAFYGHSAKRIAIPEGVTTVGSNAFYTYEQINYLSVPHTVKSTGTNQFPYSDELVWDANIPTWIFNGGKQNVENKVTIGKHVTSISRITMENIASLAAEDLTFESHWIHLEDMTKSSQLKVPLNTLQEGDYYIDADGVIYSWNEKKTAATLVYCPPHLTDYTIPATISDSAEETAAQIPVTAVGSYAFGQAQKLKTLKFENIGQVDTIADFAFARALCLASINGMTTETEINAHFATGVSLGLLPYQNTLITGAAEEDPTTEGFTAALKNDDGDSTFILSVKTSRSSNSNYEPAIDGGVKQFYTDEKATMSVTLTNPGSYEVTEDGGYVARIYMQFDKDGFAPQYGVGDHEFVAHKSTDGSQTGGRYKLNVSKVGENIYCYEFQRPINGDTYTVDVTLSYPAITTGGGSCMLWGAITEKKTETSQVPTRKEYEKLRWFSCPDTYTYTMTASRTRHDDVYTEDVLSAGPGKGRVMLSFNTKRDTKVNRPASGNAGKENVKYIDFTTTVQLPPETTLSNAAQAALEAGTAIRGSEAYTADGTRFAYLYDASETQLLSIEYDAADRKVTARYRQGWSRDYQSLRGDPQFRLQVILENPQQGVSYTATAETTETVYYDFSEPQDTGKQQASVNFWVRDPQLRVYYKVVEGLNDIYSGRSGVAGNSYTFQVFAENPYPMDYTKMGMLRDEIGWSRYLTPESLAAVFGKPQASGFTPVLTITNATLCKTADAKSVTMYDGKKRGTTSTQYTSVDAEGKYSAPISKTDPTQITNNATITMQVVNNQLQISWQYDGGSGTRTCAIEAEAIRDALEHLPGDASYGDASYIVTMGCKYTFNWWNPQGKGYTATVPGGEKIMVAKYEATIKTPLMCTYNRDLENKVSVPADDYNPSAYKESIVTACDKDGTAYQEYNSIYGGTRDVKDDFELLCSSKAQISTGYQYVQGGKDERTDRPQEESILEHTTQLSVDGKLESTLPLVEITRGAQIMLAETEKNTALEDNELETYEYNGKTYYLLAENGTYQGVWLSGKDGIFVYADSVTVSGEAGNRSYDIRAYIPAGSNNTSLRLKYLTLVRTEGTPKFEASGTVWGGDHQARRITSFYNGEWLNYELQKEIVASATADAEGKKDSAVAKGDKVIYRIRMAAYDGIQGAITLKGSQIRDILPKSLAEKFSWTKDNVAISYDTTADPDCKIENEGSWSITTDEKDANQQIITWRDDFSITFTKKPVYIYVTLTYPSADAVWNAYSDAYASRSLTNTVETLGLSSSVTHSLKIPAKAVVQQGVKNSWQIIGNQSYAGGTINTANADGRWNYSTGVGSGSIVDYYIAIKNDGKTRLYLTDLQCVMPKGFTWWSRYSSDGYTSSGATDLNTNKKDSSIYVGYRARNEGPTPEGRQKFRISFIVDNRARDHYDDVRGMYFLNPGETVQLTYSCMVGAWDETEKTAGSTVVMPYYDVGDAGVELGDTRFEYDKNVNQNVEQTPNDDKSPTINDKAWAAANGFNTDGWEEDSRWLTSTVTMYRGKAELGLEKKLTSTDGSPDKRPGSATNTEKLNWSIVAKNSGTTAVEDYVISDTMDAPYEFVWGGSLKLWYDGNHTYYSNAGNYANMPVYQFSFDAATKTVKYSNNELPTDGTAKKFKGTLQTYVYDTAYKYNVEYEVSYTWAANAAAPTISFRFKDPAIAIVPHGQAELCLSTKKPTGSDNVNQTYVNTAWMTPLKDGVWDETATIGMLDKTLQTGYWDDPKTSIRSSANVVVAYGYSTSSTLEASQTYDGKPFTASSDGTSTTILPDKQGNIHYTMTVDNTVYQTPSELTKLVLINNLPQPGDHNTFQDGDLRGSEYQIDLAENPNFKVTVTVIDPKTKKETSKIVLTSDQYRIEYTDQTSFNDTDWSGGENGGKWKSESTGARSFRIVIADKSGATMPAHSKITVEYDAKADAPDSIEPGQTAYNSFGYHYQVKDGTELEAAPMGVGLRTPYVPTLQKRLETPDEEPMTAAADTAFQFVIYSGTELNLRDGFTEADVAKALKDRQFTVAEATVQAGQSASESPWLNKLVTYSSNGSVLEPTETAWEWKDGTIYRIIELPVTGDYRYGSINRSTARSYSFTYNYTNKNTLQCVNIGTSWEAKLTKIDADTKATLADAYFALYSQAPADQMTDENYDALTVTKKPAKSREQEGKTWYLKSVEKTGANGTLTWAGLSESEYLYVEVQAPNGYNLDSTVHTVTRPTGGGTAAIDVTNKPGYNLPETGGIGTWPFMAAGLLLTGTALALLLKKRKTNN